MSAPELPGFKTDRLPENVQRRISEIYSQCHLEYADILILLVAHLLPGLKLTGISNLVTAMGFNHLKKDFKTWGTNLAINKALRIQQSACYPTGDISIEEATEWMHLPLLKNVRKLILANAQKAIESVGDNYTLSVLFPVCRGLRLMGEHSLAWQLLKQTQRQASKWAQIPATYELAYFFMCSVDRTLDDIPNEQEDLLPVLLPSYYCHRAQDELPSFHPIEWWAQHPPADKYDWLDRAGMFIFMAAQSGNWDILHQLSVGAPKNAPLSGILELLNDWQNGKWSSLTHIFDVLEVCKKNFNTDFAPLKALLSPLTLICYLRLKRCSENIAYHARYCLLSVYTASNVLFADNTIAVREVNFHTEKITWLNKRPLDLLPKALGISNRTAFPAISEAETEALYRACLTLRDKGLGLYAFYMANALHCFPCYTDAQHAELEAILQSRPDLPLFCKNVTMGSTHDRVLAELGAIRKQTTAGTPEQEKRILWVLQGDEKAQTLTHFTARIQKRKANGKFSPGQRVFIPHLIEGKHNEYLSEKDKQFVNVLREAPAFSFWRSSFEEEISQERITALCGSPNIVLSLREKEYPIELEAMLPTLNISKGKKEIKLQIDGLRQKDVKLIHLGGNKYGVYQQLPEHEQVCRILETYSGKLSMNFPLSYHDKLVEKITGFSDIFRLTGDIGGDSIKERDAEYKGVVQMRGENGMLQGCLRLELIPGGPLVVFGQGEKNFFLRDEETAQVIHRDLKEERNLLAKLMALCPTLEAAVDSVGCWHTPVTDEALRILEELQNCPPQMLEVRWPDGDALSIKTMQDFTAFDINVSKSSSEWLQIGGDVRVDENLVMKLTELLRCIQTEPGQYVRLDASHFLRLSRNLERQLRTLSAVARPIGKGTAKKKDAQISTAALLLLGQAEGDAPLPAILRDKVQEITQRYNTVARLPRQLRADLRDYQKEGYRWLQSLMNCGLGACLADDMGLGKTLQVLSVLLARATDGPSLVIAPVSVCSNWMHEASRFTPTLTTHMLGAENRKETVEKLGKRDVLVCSYGLLVTERELLAEVNWNIIVLDEAQYIKNDTSQRAQAAGELSAKCRIAATGTPIENNLAELRSIFDFLNPGFLGTRDEFNTKFTATTEQRKLLRRIVSPFILRRLKGDVLDELPPKTETTHYITLSDKERALYEATRREALVTAQESENRFSILAQLMKLRRLCCHPQLALPESGLPSAKLTALLELAQELRESGHRALIFSQFTDMLAHVRALFNRHELSYSYLDGSTPQKNRAKAVEQFNAGETDFFLISLKAGGTGLNLTTADYVILLDPWWNPAVEDQAADRTHRIGQRHPVTICRLVCSDTIEERVLKLHKDKRQLVDDVLSGEKKSTPLSIKELTELI